MDIAPALHTLEKSYKDRQFEGTKQDWDDLINNSTTLYIGNLSFVTSEAQLLAIFSFCGQVKRIIMGLDRFNKTPCGFAFVEFYERAATVLATELISGSRLDDRIVRADIDPGFKNGRQYGRGKSGFYELILGGQVRDEYREEYDSGRGGVGAAFRDSQEQRSSNLRDTYRDTLAVPSGSSSQFYTGQSSAKESSKYGKRERVLDEDDEDQNLQRSKKAAEDDII